MNYSLTIKVKVALQLTVSQSVNFGVEPHLGLMARYLLLFELRFCFLWGVLSDERTGLSFVYVTGPCQRSLSRVRVSWYSRPYFTVSDLALTIESESDVTTDGQSASLSLYKAPIRGLRPDFYFRLEYGIRLTVMFLIPWVTLSDERMGLSFVCAAGLASAVFLGS
jgi:hypothetical protein